MPLYKVHIKVRQEYMSDEEGILKFIDKHLAIEAVEEVALTRSNACMICGETVDITTTYAAASKRPWWRFWERSSKRKCTVSSSHPCYQSWIGVGDNTTGQYIQ